MKTTFNLHITASIWQKSFTDLPETIQKSLDVCDEELDPDSPTEVNFILTDDAEIRTINQQYRQQDKATNVLSFPAQIPDNTPISPKPLGDIYIAYEIVIREAESQDKKPEHHLTHLIIHGLLHLYGYDHIDDDEAEEMEALEILILSKLSIQTPYNDSN
jgi:probable rRNA maturation factor